MNQSQSRTSDGNPVETLKQGMRDIGKNVTDVAQQTATDAKKMTADMADQAKKMGNDFAEQVTDAGTKQLRQFEQRIKRQPLNSILISAGVGVVIGMLLRK